MIDCDVHQNLNSPKELAQYLDPGFRDFFLFSGHEGYSFPNYPWYHPTGFNRRDAAPPAGGIAGSDYEFMKQQLLDAYDVEYAILTGEDILSVSSLPNPQFASAIASAYNRWLIEEWLSQDKRLKGSLAIAPQDAEGAAREIRALGDHPDIVQVIVPTGAVEGYGAPRYHPIYEAAVEKGLPVAMHVGGEGIGMNAPPTATGYPTYYIEWHTLHQITVMSHIVSLICHGVFEKFRELRIVVIEAGMVWLPGVLWRLDGNWKALHAEVPWIKELPSTTVSQHMWFTTQPLEQPRIGRHLRELVQTIEGIDHMLLFSSDYPHWDFEEPIEVTRRLPKEWRNGILSGNARALYGLPTRIAVEEGASANMAG